ncbi:FAD-binding protein [Streptomyces sp. NPDC057027]|uniref:FAD-binding protein n=1 Tax=Streptomyces sp. NPDC057027 TaxID=3346004 RepID=UPI003632B4F4
MPRVTAARDRQIANPCGKDVQIQDVHNARQYRGDRLGRAVVPPPTPRPRRRPPHRSQAPRPHRKTLGGIQTDLDSRALAADGTPVDGLYAAGEAAGFGGGGVHGYNALEGTFLGGCLLTGRQAGRAAAQAVGSRPVRPDKPEVVRRLSLAPHREIARARRNTQSVPSVPRSPAALPDQSQATSPTHCTSAWPPGGYGLKSTVSRPPPPFTGRQHTAHDPSSVRRDAASCEGAVAACRRRDRPRAARRRRAPGRRR